MARKLVNARESPKYLYLRQINVAKSKRGCEKYEFVVFWNVSSEEMCTKAWTEHGTQRA